MKQAVSESKTDEQVEMSFLEHLDELRRRLTFSVIFIVIAFFACWFVSDKIFRFLAAPINEAISEAQNRQFTLEGLQGETVILELNALKEGEKVRYVFAAPTQLGVFVVPAGVSVEAQVSRNDKGELGIYTTEPLTINRVVIPSSVRVPADFAGKAAETKGFDDNLVVTTVTESFTLYVTASIYTALALSIPFLLFQIWQFIAPGLYPHERGYVTPFIGLSTISFVCGAAFAYYVLFPPAARYLLGLGSDFRLMLRASEYFDFIVLIMLGMGIVFQMPAVSYVLARIGLISAGLLIRVWKIAVIVILIVAAVVSPTADALNMMLFAAPMFVLYLISIFVAWIFGRKRQAEDTASAG